MAPLSPQRSDLYPIIRPLGHTKSSTTAQQQQEQQQAVGRNIDPNSNPNHEYMSVVFLNELVPTQSPQDQQVTRQADQLVRGELMQIIGELKTIKTGLACGIFGISMIYVVVAAPLWIKWILKFMGYEDIF
jgi:hypothetical protein